MKGCELCGSPARMYCESDQASLCWDCDEKVHGANFLVAKHCRALLCQACQSPTPWKASGPKLGPTVSVCESCFAKNNQEQQVEEDQDQDQDEESRGRNQVEEQEFDHLDDDSDDDDEEEEEEEDSEDFDEEEEEDGENQVVPWSVASVESPAPPVACSSSSEEWVSCGFPGVKRMRESSNVDLDSDDEIGCSSSHIASGRLIINEAGSSLGSFRPLKHPRTSEDEDHHDGQVESRSTAAIINSLKRFQRDIVTNAQSPSATILGICRLSRDQRP